jgi:ABC-type proline/glycine betaine transport system permease subunit
VAVALDVAVALEVAVTLGLCRARRGHALKVSRPATDVLTTVPWRHRSS